jgi:single-stranded DNA-binding protein
MSIDCAFFGFLAVDAERRTSQVGKDWVRLRIGVGRDEAMQWVSVAVFGQAVAAAAELKKADHAYVEGTIRLESWRGNDGAERHGLSVAAFKCEPTHQIGRNKPKRQRRQNLETGTPVPTAATIDGGCGYSADIHIIKQRERAVLRRARLHGQLTPGG